MKAFALGSADAPASVMDLPTPDIDATRIRIAIGAASVNGFDVYQANGYLAGMMEHIYPTVIGRDFAGVVDAVGSAVNGFAVGDEVIGFIPSTPPLKSGAFAEFVAGGSDLILTRKPAGLDVESAAALPLAGSAALDLLEAVAAESGDIILVVGATGGVGTMVVQLAAGRGIRVVATARPDEDAFVRDLGAVDTIDYTAGPVAEGLLARYPERVAALIDLVDQKDALTALSAVVHPGGHLASLLGAADPDALTASGSVFGHNVTASPTPEKIARLAAMAENGEVRVPIQSSVPLDRAGDAIAAFSRGTRGKLIIRM